MNGRYPIALHILTLLNKTKSELLSSDYIAGSININPALVRKEISNLRKHGFIASKEGKGGGYSIAKPGSQITLADIYNAVKEPHILGVAKNTPNPDCAIGKQINKNIEELYIDLDTAFIAKLGTITLEDFSNKFV
ncbi:MAG: Rrf2 family transcriptional regulator [Bacteroidetes bacterium]|nr:Rrf2 family transcriptional regulator [Bacteroidota bacterium]